MHWDKRYGFGPRIEIPKAKAANLRRKVKARTGTSSTPCSLASKLQELNPILRGWANYYGHCAYAGRVFTSLDWYTGMRKARWLHRKRPNAGRVTSGPRASPVAGGQRDGFGAREWSSNICSPGPPSAASVSHGWRCLTLPCLLESRVRNERRMLGSGRGGKKPAAERQRGAHRLLYYP
ncbi:MULTISPECIES: group II intron maturase-specific domain-containing protein [unclassified Mesorhizobium]|uniref:group II intron maturase-specific domain-containing protein n=1 Tax=unclassified Mesorhizobium TaxID=325217 RepID=UPI001FE03C97|nr:MULTISPECIES: group II intron maturase-specific domain-containing protein [unclassified Mesorhizobium]